MVKRLSIAWLIVVLAGIVWIGWPHPAQAEGVVGEGFPASCTEDAFRAALAGGGSVTFNCGASPVTIPLMFPNDLIDSTVIDGGGLVTLDGGGSTQLFIVNPGVQLDLHGITLTGGSARRGGAIYNNNGTVNIFDSTLINNAADVLGDPVTDGRGGAIFNDGGTVAIVRTTVAANHALHSSVIGTGGAIYSQGGVLIISNSQFVANIAGVTTGSRKGGAVAARAARLDIQHGIFAFNIASWSGGAIWMQDSAFQYVDNTANYNIARREGGAIHSDNSSGAFLDSTFENNRANEGDGGALVLSGGSEQELTASVGIKGSTFKGNRATRGGGGAIQSSGTALSIFQTRLMENRAGFGGAIHIWDAFIDAPGDLYADEVEFSHNTATGSGGAVALGTRNTLITRSLFYRNTSEFEQESWLGPSGGGAVYVYNGNFAEFENTTFSFNIAERGGALFIDEESRGGATADVIYSTFYRNRAHREANAIYGEARIFAHNLVYTEEGAGGRNCNRDQGAARGELSFQYPGSSCGGRLPVIDPLLDPLADNGGFTLTHDFRNDIPGTVSEAIDRIPLLPDGTCDYDIVDDQRREARPFDALGTGGGCDLGALETRRAFGPATEGLVEVTPTPVPTEPPQFVPQCGDFAVQAPRDGMANGLQTFYWQPAPDATSYQLLIYDAEQGPLVASADIPAPASSATVDVSTGAIGGGFQFRYELHALYNGQIFCTDVVNLPRAAPEPGNPPPEPTQEPRGPVCGNGICELGENPNNCPADCP